MGHKRPGEAAPSRRPASHLGGFSLIENVFSALVIAVVILGMSTVISTYSINQGKTKDRPFAMNLAQQQMDEVMMKLVTQNAMVFDNAPVPRGRSYFLRAESLTVSAFFFNNFPFDALPDPVLDPADPNDNKEMTTVPWESTNRLLERRPVPVNIQDGTYVSAIGSNKRPYIQSTLFYRNRFYTAGGQLSTLGDEDDPVGYFDLAGARNEMSMDSPPKYAVRMQLFGIPDASASDPALNIGDMIRASERLRAADYPNDPRTPPCISGGCATAQANTYGRYLIGDSCVSGPSVLSGATGRIYIRERSAEGNDDPSYFPHFTTKVVVARVYRIDDFIDDGTFYTGAGNPDREIASSSAVLVGRVQRK